MLLLSEIARLRATVDSEWRSPQADAIADAWGYPPGSALLWRCSATHVFVVLSADGKKREGFLRFVPAGSFRRGDFESIAVLMARLADRGLAVIRPLPSSAGRLVETIDTDYGQAHAMMVANAAGEQLDVEGMTSEQARAWGAALARLHRDGSPATTGLALADGLDRVRRALALLDGDPELAQPASMVCSRLERLPRGPDCYGLVHGDFELDNLTWTGNVPVAYDWDEAERSWFAADIAYATRDLVPNPGALVHQPPPLLEAFLVGYHDERPLPAVDCSQLLFFTAVNALRSVVRLQPVLAEDPAAGRNLTAGVPSASRKPSSLRAVLEEHVQEQRQIALASLSLGPVP